MGIAIQVMFMSQSLIITKILGLGAVASFAVCSKVPMLLMQLINRPFDAFNPRWQIYWAQGQTEPVVKEYRRMLRFTLGLAALAMICCLATNRWFVFIFGKESLYAGKPFDFFFALFVMGQVWLHCVSYNFILAKRMKHYAAIVVVDTIVSLGVAIAGTKWLGLTGYAAFTAVYVLTGISFWYISLKSPRLLNLSTGSLLQDSRASLLFFPAVLLGSLLVFQEIASPAWLVVAEAGAVVIAIVWFLVSFWPDLQGMLLRLNRARKNQGADPDANPVQ
jgi:O-antigen/teichoic acid export membrane protein